MANPFQVIKLSENCIAIVKELLGADASAALLDDASVLATGSKGLENGKSLRDQMANSMVTNKHAEVIFPNNPVGAELLSKRVMAQKGLGEPLSETETARLDGLLLFKNDPVAADLVTKSVLARKGLGEPLSEVERAHLHGHLRFKNDPSLADLVSRDHLANKGLGKPLSAAEQTDLRAALKAPISELYSSSRLPRWLDGLELGKTNGLHEPPNHLSSYSFDNVPKITQLPEFRATGSKFQFLEPRNPKPLSEFS